MKEVSNKCVGVSYRLQVPETAEEYDHAAGKIGACVESANKNVIYRSTNAQFRAAFAAAVEDETGIERETAKVGSKTVTDDDGNETTEDVYGYSETEKAYLDRVYAELGLGDEDAIMSKFGDIVASIEAELVFDPSERERATKERKPRKAFLNIANAVLERGGPDGLSRVIAKLCEELDVTVEDSVEGLARALQIKDSRRDLASELLG